MAAYSGTPTVVSGWTVVASPKRIKYKLLTIVLSSQGGATNYIPASALGFTTIVGSSMAQESDDSRACPTAPSYDGSKLFFYSVANATDATRDDPVDVSGTFRVLVWGSK